MRVMKVLLLLALTIKCFGQIKKDRFQLEVNYGMNGNFFVRNYDERNIPNVWYQFNNKNFWGSIGGIEARTSLGKQWFLGLGYEHSVNKRRINFTPTNAPVYIEDFRIRHDNNFFKLIVEKQYGKRSGRFAVSTGLFYMTSAQQEVELSPNGLSFEERNLKNSGMEEGGTFIGLRYSRKIDTHFQLGLKAQVYYLISTSTFEAISLAPTLTYGF